MKRIVFFSFLFLASTFHSKCFAQASATVVDSNTVRESATAESDAEELSLDVHAGEGKTFVDKSATITSFGKLPWEVTESNDKLASFRAKTPTDAPGKTYTSRFKGTFAGSKGTKGEPIEWKVRTDITVQNVVKFIVNVDNPPKGQDGRYTLQDRNSVRKRGLDIGHATWKIELPSELSSKYPEELKKAANIVRGLGPADSTAFTNALYNAARQTAAGGSISFSVSGNISSGRPGKEVGSFQIKSEETVKAALQHTLDVSNTPPNYAIPDHNCVDACIAAISAAGKNVGDCKQVYKIRYYPPNKKDKFKDFNLQLSDPTLLIEQAKNLK